MELFWSNGYESTGVKELLGAMNIGRQSLYDTFGDKRGLYLASIEHYSGCVTQQIVDGLTDRGSPLENIRGVLNELANPSEATRRRGCLLTNTLVEAAPHDEQIAQLANQVLGRIESAFYTALKSAIGAGELSRETPARKLARYFSGCVQGLMVLWKTSQSRKPLQDFAEVSLSVLDPYR